MDDPEAAPPPRGKPIARRLVPLACVAAVVAAACVFAVPGGADGEPSSADKARMDSFVERFQRAQQLFGGGRDAEAEEILRALAQEEPQAAPVHHALAFISWGRGRHDEALRQFAEAARLAPEDGAVRRDLGLRLVEVGRDAEAMPHLEAAVRLAAPDVETLCAYGRTLEGAGRPAAAERSFRQALAADSDSVDARTLLARAILAKAPAESLALVETIPTSWPDVVAVRALALERLSRWDEASAMHRRIAETAPSGAPGIPWLRDAAEGLIRTGNARLAAELAALWTERERAARGPSLRSAACLAVAHAGSGDAKAALAALDSVPVPEKTPAAVRAHLDLVRAHLLATAGRPDEARAVLAAVAELPDAAAVPFERAVAGHVLGRRPAADLDAAAGSEPGRANDVAWAAWLRATLEGDPKASAEARERALAASKPPGEHPGMLLRGAR